MAEEVEYMIEDAEAHSDDIEFMQKAIDDKAVWVLAYASERLLADKELILKAAAVDGQVLYYASKRLRGDKDVAMAVITQSTKSSIYLTDEILKDPDIDAILNPPEETQQ